MITLKQKSGQEMVDSEKVVDASKLPLKVGFYYLEVENYLQRINVAKRNALKIFKSLKCGVVWS